jgi:hypothetical protein
MNKYDQWFNEISNMNQEERLLELKKKQVEIQNLELQIFVYKLFDTIEYYKKSMEILKNMIHNNEIS